MRAVPGDPPAEPAAGWISQGSQAAGQAPEQFAAFIRGEIEKWAKVVKASGAKIDN